MSVEPFLADFPDASLNRLVSRLRSELSVPDFDALVAALGSSGDTNGDALSRIPRGVALDAAEPVLTPQGHRISPLVNKKFKNLCSGALVVSPRGLASVHKHPKTDVIVFVVCCGAEGAVTFYGENLEFAVRQHIFDQVALPRNVDHTVFNPSRTMPIIAVEFRSSSDVLADTVLSGHLQSVADDKSKRLISAIDNHWAS